MIYQNSLDILVVTLYSDDQGVIIIRIDSDGILLEKGDVSLWFPLHALGKPRDITFFASTCLAYLLREELELPPPVKPPNIVFVSKHRVLLVIFIGKMERFLVKEVWPRLFLPEPHGERRCTGQKVHVCISPLERT